MRGNYQVRFCGGRGAVMLFSPTQQQQHYAGLGGTRYIGKPKRPTLLICTLVDGEYEIQQLRGDQAIASPTFPNLKLTAEQVLRAGQ